MAALASVGDLDVLVDRDLPPGDPAATLALELASGAVRSYTRQQLEHVVDDVADLRADPRGFVELPERPVRGVARVELDDGTVYTDPASWTLDRGRLFTGSPLHGLVTVTYTHGYTPIPDDVRAVTLSVAARILDNPAGLRSEQLPGYSATYGLVGLELDDGERAVLSRYRRRTYS